MDRRYQVFISSTFSDLQDERRKVIQTVMELDCFPAGMELFPAADEEQWEFIKRVINDCDYYLMIIGGRYGSITKEGISYTEKEYEYAVERNLRILAFIHEKPGDIPADKSELDPHARTRLDLFREKISTGRLVKSWTRADELPGMVALSLTKTIKAYPSIGWVRGSDLPSTEVLAEMNDLRKQITELQTELAASRAAASTPMLSDLASLESVTNVDGTYRHVNSPRHWALKMTWKELFGMLAPELLDRPNDMLVRARLVDLLFKRSGKDGHSPSISDFDFGTIKVQLLAQRLVTIDNLRTLTGGLGLFWQLTAFGQQVMLETRTVRAEAPSAGAHTDEG